MKHLDARGVFIGFILGLAVLPQSPFSTSSSRVETTKNGHTEGVAGFPPLLLSPRSLVSACSACGFEEPTISRPVGSDAWLAMEREAHRRWNLLWKDGKWTKAPRVEIEAVRTICTYENRAGNPLRYSGCAPSHRHRAESKPRHAASTAYGLGQFLKATRDSLDRRYPSQFNWECALCQYRGVWVYIGPHRPKYKSPSALVSRGGSWRGY